MSLRVRLLLLVLLIAVPAAGIFLLLRSDQGAEVQPRNFTSSADCQPCHAQVFAEWDASHHRIAYTNPEVRKLSDDFQQKECAACHLPRPVFETGLGQRTLQRQARPLEGVDCFACHLDEQGRIVGSRDVPGAACQPRRDERFLSMELCRSCHDQHQTTQQWDKSEYPRRGITCNTCHMPEATRTLAAGGARPGRGHVFEGCHDPEVLKRAATTTAAIKDGKLTVVVTNTGAGHNFPTEERHRAVDIVVRFVPKDGEPGAWQRLFRFRQPYKGEPGENTQLPAHASHTATADVPQGGGTAEVRLLYKLNPFMEDQDAVVVFAWSGAYP